MEFSLLYLDKTHLRPKSVQVVRGEMSHASTCRRVDNDDAWLTHLTWGMLIDAAHLSEASVRDLYELTAALPVVHLLPCPRWIDEAHLVFSPALWITNLFYLPPSFYNPH